MLQDSLGNPPTTIIPVSSGWFPIESAPKDGALIDIFWELDGYGEGTTNGVYWGKASSGVPRLVSSSTLGTIEPGFGWIEKASGKYIEGEVCYWKPSEFGKHY